MPTALSILHAFWQTLGEMAPWLLFGFAAAGVLSVWVKKSTVEKHLGGPGPGPVVKAAVVGVPLPLCSCGVLPFASSMYRQGASRGATSSFLLSTPQTGVDAFFATWALMGPVFALVRPAIAFVHGVLAGLAVNALAGARPVDPPPATDTGACCGTAPPNIKGTRTDGSNSLFSKQNLSEFRQSRKNESDPEGLACCDATFSEPEVATTCCDSNSDPKPQPANGTASPKPWRTALRFATITLPSDLAGSLLIGVAIAAALMALVPPDALTPYLGGGVLSMGAAVIVGVPLYLCATASIPVALGLIAVGASPGAALAFLIAGPATNAATLAVTWKLMGPRTGLTYLISVVIVAITAGLALDATFTLESLHLPTAALYPHDHTAPWWHHAAAAVLLALLLPPVFKRLANLARKTPPPGATGGLPASASQA